MILSAVLKLPTRLDSVVTARHALDDLLNAAGVTEPVSWDLSVALTEACSNAVRHAPTGRSYEVTIHLADNCCRIEIRDQGPGFDPDHVEIPRIEDVGSRGLLLMRAVVDRLIFEALQPRGMKVTMVKSWDRGFGRGAATAR